MPRVAKRTHRVYLVQGSQGLTQSKEPTDTFYDVDADHPIQFEGAVWLPVTQAGMGMSRTWKVLYERVPDGAQDGITIDELGARMQLIRNRWYVDEAAVDQEKWTPLPPSRITCLQIVTGVLILGYSLWMLTTSRQVSGTWTLFVAGLAAVLLIADYLIQRRGQ